MWGALSCRVAIAAVFVCAGACQLDDPVEPTAPPRAAVAPVIVASHSCTEYAAQELSVPAVSGEYAIGSHRVAVDVDGGAVAWRSTVGIDAVVVGGRVGAHAYVYRGEATGDRDLVAPQARGRSPDALERIRFCYDWELSVELSVASSFSRRTNWTVDRRVAQRSLRLAPAQAIELPYSVEAAVTSVTDGPMSIAGTLEISNPAPLAANVTGLDATALGSAIELRCDAVLPFEIPPGGAAVCTYSTVALAPKDGVVRAGVSTSGLVEATAVTAPVSTSSSRIDTTGECIEVLGHRGQRLGTSCSASSPDRYEYSVEVGPYDCGRHRDDSLGIDIDVACGAGCTRTASYWQSSEHARLPGAERAGLKAELAAANRNIEAGASPDDVAPALEAATALLATYSAGDVAGAAVVGEQFRRVSRQLRDYNAGRTGPGPCSE